MRIGRCLLFVLIGALVIGDVQVAFGNGRTPPPPPGGSPLKATCRQSGGGELEIFRVRLIGVDDFDETLKVISRGVTEELSLREIKLLIFFTPEIDENGFMNAKIVRIDGTEETSTMVQVRSEEATIRLIGFRSSGSRASIDLFSCQAVEFALVHGEAADSNHGPVAEE